MERAPFLDDEQDSQEKLHTSLHSATFTRRGGTKHWLVSTTTAYITAALVIAFFLISLMTPRNGGSVVGVHQHMPTTFGVHNATLGFGAIILMSLPERTDRRDGMSLIASTSGIQITKTIEATRGENIAPKAKPYGNAVISDGYLGSWRTHMDALKYVVDNRIETALLFEDDVDWDVRIKTQLSAFSHGLENSPLRNRSSIPISPHHPYGNDWDIMHLGCVIIKQAPSPYEKIHARFVDPERPIAPGCSIIKEQNTGDPEFCWDPLLKSLGVPSDSRAILPSYFSIGLPAIAVTYEGAQRILFELSWKRLDNTLDWSVQSLLQQGRVRGWTVVPPLFGMYKVGSTLDSDLFGAPGERKSQIEGHSLGIERSARRALNDTFGGDSRHPNRWTSQYWEQFGIGAMPPTP